MKKRGLIFLSSIAMFALIAINVSIGMVNNAEKNTYNLAIQLQQANARDECAYPTVPGYIINTFLSEGPGYCGGFQAWCEVWLAEFSPDPNGDCCAENGLSWTWTKCYC